MFTLARKVVFGLLATTLVIGTAHVASAKPWYHPHPWYHTHPWHHSYHGPFVYVKPVTVIRPVAVIPADIQLVNPAANQVALNYTLNAGPVQSLPAGTAVEIHQQSIVAFDRGGAAGWGRFSLTGGVYEFMPANGTWKLVQESPGSLAGGPIIAGGNPVPVN